VPTELIHFLIRRGGARLVDLVVEQCDADLRRACFFFGERVKGLRRDGLAVDAIDEKQWCSLFELCTTSPVSWEAWRDLVEWMIIHPDGDFLEEAEVAGIGRAPEGWSEQVANTVAGMPSDRRYSSDQSRIRHLMGVVMDELRGRVPASKVEALIQELLAAE
jgi:Glu-tRNA(Gln) amidotransferase subunit E-like FAD-binding protein